MKYVYVVSKANRRVTVIDFTDETVIDLLEYDNEDFDKGVICTWDEANVSDFVDYISVAELTSGFGEEDIIIPSDLLLKEICDLLNNLQYNLWESSCDICLNMLGEYSKFVDKISLEDLIKVMQ